MCVLACSNSKRLKPSLQSPAIRPQSHAGSQRAKCPQMIAASPRLPKGKLPKGMLALSKGKVPQSNAASLKGKVPQSNAASLKGKVPKQCCLSPRAKCLKATLPQSSGSARAKCPKPCMHGSPGAKCPKAMAPKAMPHGKTNPLGLAPCMPSKISAFLVGALHFQRDHEGCMRASGLRQCMQAHNDAGWL